MSKTVMSSIKQVLLVVLLGVGLVSVPILPAHALREAEPTVPPAPEGLRAARLERVWLRQQRILNRLEFMFDHSQQRLDRAQELIDKAAANGKDVSSVQAALDAFVAALQEARPLFANAQGMIATHQGFDASGKVVDPELATATVNAMTSKLGEIRDVLFSPGRALMDAIRAYREANRQR